MLRAIICLEHLTVALHTEEPLRAAVELCGLAGPLCCGSGRPAIIRPALDEEAALRPVTISRTWSKAFPWVRSMRPLTGWPAAAGLLYSTRGKAAVTRQRRAGGGTEPGGRKGVAPAVFQNKTVMSCLHSVADAQRMLYPLRVFYPSSNLSSSTPQYLI